MNCEYYIEVGTSNVLSRMIDKCFPVETKVGEFESLNITLAQAFVRGANINWAELYRNRLIKPFNSYKDFLYIPKETPLETKPGVFSKQYNLSHKDFEQGKINLFIKLMNDLKDDFFNPISNNLLKHIISGKWDLIVKNPKVEIYTPISEGDFIEGRIEECKFQDSQVELSFGWHKADDLVATSKMVLSWVKVITYGVTEARELPEFFHTILN